MAWYDYVVDPVVELRELLPEYDPPLPQYLGTWRPDSLWGTDSDNWIVAKGGNDRLKGYGGADLLDGGDGIDTAYYGDSTVGVAINLATGRGFGGSAEGDTLISIENVFGSLHNDTLIGDDASNELYGLSGTDVLKGGGGADGLAGDTGDDILKGGGGADYLEGGEGFDTASYNDSPEGVFVSLTHNVGAYGDAWGDTFASIENLSGSIHDDNLWGDALDNVLDGMDGNDALFGYAGQDRLNGGYGVDTLYGMEGNDILDGGAGADNMIGNAGSDTYYVDDAGDAITEAGGQGIDTVYTSVSYNLTEGADVELLATTNDGGTAAINLTGNANGNVVIGNAGDNVIAGGNGDDELTGLGGQDSFLFDTALSEAFNIDSITDFNVADDTIRLDDDIFTSGLLAGNSVAGSQFVIGAAALDAGDRIIYNSSTGAVYYDSDGTGGAAQIQFATLATGLALTNFDFLVVA
jgi:Ca2+-binding RTX toxin-like protein